tara:strand:+ start:149 stop:448 length:300 start_codon:yes stop_codon:yes gene_type:complete
MIVHKNPYFEIILKNNYYAYKPKNKEVIILSVIDKNKFLSVKSKRILLKKSIYELPAGSIKKNKLTTSVSIVIILQYVIKCRYCYYIAICYKKNEFNIL